jgi:hypothetical protein
MATRIKKFNGGEGAILCNRCRVIIKEGWTQITKEDWASDEPIYCEDCLKNIQKNT